VPVGAKVPNESVPPRSYLPAMSCTPVTPAMRQLLEACADSPKVDTNELRPKPEWGQARAWGWVMESGELTGTGWGHVKKLPRVARSESMMSIRQTVAHRREHHLPRRKGGVHHVAGLAHHSRSGPLLQQANGLQGSWGTGGFASHSLFSHRCVLFGTLGFWIPGIRGTSSAFDIEGVPEYG
jgi:hypothetical protein